MRNVVLFGICICALGLAADAPYAGKWKMNMAKSDFGDMNMTYESMPGGEMKVTMDGMSYTFKTDGKDNMTPWGSTAAWKSTGANSWEMIEKTNGKVSATSTVKISADGKMLTVDSKRAKADGGTSNDTMNFTRVSGGPGLAGKWKTKNMTSSAPDTMILTPKGADGVNLALGNEGANCDAKFDGKPYPAVGTMWPAGWTCVVAKNGARGLDVTWQKDGKPLYKSTLMPSDDGKTLTESSTAVASGDKVKIVYDKQ
jgi:hypothetical protein